jgi:hypothetical protein
MDPTMTKTNDNNSLSDDISEFEKLVQQQQNREEQKVIFGLSVIQKYSLDASQAYQCIDFYDVEQGYIIMCNIVNSNHFKEQIQFESMLIMIIPIRMYINHSFQIN